MGSRFQVRFTLDSACLTLVLCSQTGLPAIGATQAGVSKCMSVIAVGNREAACPQVPVLALTATATDLVRENVIRVLGLKQW